MGNHGVSGNLSIVNFKEIHIGALIRQQVAESNIDVVRICNFFNACDQDIYRMYESKSLDTEILLKWCKLLKYDFFRFYTQHLILYSPHRATEKSIQNPSNKDLPAFRKNIYTKEVIEFILELISKEEKTTSDVIQEYRIPKTTLYRWIKKYKK